MTASVTTLPTPAVTLHTALVKLGCTEPIAAKLAQDSCGCWLLAAGMAVTAVARILVGDTGPID